MDSINLKHLLDRERGAMGGLQWLTMPEPSKWQNKNHKKCVYGYEYSYKMLGSGKMAPQ